jgi:hypothetical protein
MHENQRVADMVNEVLVRQAKARVEGTGEPFEVALEAVLGTEAGRQLRKLRDGPHTVGRGRFSGRRTSHGGVGESVSRPPGSSLCLWRLSSES